MSPENNFTALSVVKGLKEAVLDAGMRITGEKNFRPRNRERTEAHHGTEAKQLRERSPVQVEQRNDEMQLHCCTSGVL